MSYITNSLFDVGYNESKGFSWGYQSPAWYGTTNSRDFIPVGLNGDQEEIYSLLLPQVNENTTERVGYSSKNILYVFSGYYSRNLLSGNNILCSKGILLLNVDGQLKVVMLATRAKNARYGDSLTRRTDTRFYIDPCFEEVEPTLFRYFKKKLFPDVIAGGTPIVYINNIRGMYFDGVKIPKFTSLPQRIEWEKQLVQVIPDEVLTETNEEEQSTGQ